MTTAVHPDLGVRVLHVIPDAWGPHVDIRACYTQLAERCPWTNVIRPYDFDLRIAQGLDDPADVYVLWAGQPVPVRERGSYVLGVYSEAIGPEEIMLLDHVQYREDYRGWARTYDGVLAHTPWMTTELARLGLHDHVELLPVGWDPVAMGSPRWGNAKHRELIHWGSRVGRRHVVVPRLEARLGGRFADVTGLYGRSLAGALDTASWSLYVAHSSVRSYSTWRIWQHLPSSCAIISEPGDDWPLGEDHRVRIGPFTMDNLEREIDELDRILRETDSDTYARRLYADLGPEYTVDRVTARYLLPAIEAAIARRGAGDSGLWFLEETP
jgi:hypothetical protein